MSTKYNKNILINGFFNIKQSQTIILSYLNVSQLQNLYDAIDGNISWSMKNIQNNNRNTTTEQLQQLIKSFIFYLSFIAPIDNSFYYSVYDNKQFYSQINQTSILNLAQKHYSQTNIIMQNYTKLYQRLQISANMNQNEVEQIKMIVTDPVMALPYLMKDKIGKYMRTVYQGFVFRNSNICNEDIENNIKISDESSFLEFNNIIKENQEKYIKQIISGDNSQVKSVLDKIKQILNINKNEKNFTVENEQQFNYSQNKLSNFIILILSLVKNMLFSYKLHINSLQSNPFVQFMQLLIKFSTYKNFIMQIQQQFGHAFKIFKEIVQLEQIRNYENFESFEDGFEVREIMMKMFYQNMKEQIDGSFKIYKQLVNTYRIMNRNQDSQDYENLQESLSYFQSILSGQQSHQIIKYLLNDYSEMFVDISIDKSNISWNGHSQQTLNEPFFEFQNKLLEEQFKSMQNIKENDRVEKQKKLIEEINFLKDQLNIKPHTLKKLIKKFNILNINFGLQQNDNQIQKLNQQWPNRFSSKRNFKIYESQSTSPSSDNQSMDEQRNSWQYISETSEQIILESEMDIEI